MTSRDHAGPQNSGSTHRRTLALNRIVLSATRCSPPECGLDGPVPAARLRVVRNDNVPRAGDSCVGCYLRLDALVGLDRVKSDVRHIRVRMQPLHLNSDTLEAYFRVLKAPPKL